MMNNPQAMNNWMNTMMQNQTMMNQWMGTMMNNPQFIQNMMYPMMNDPKFSQQMYGMMFQNQQFMQNMMNSTQFQNLGDNDLAKTSIPIVINHISNENNITIPEWIKNNAGWWADGSIDGNSFVQGIQYLIQNRILRI